MPDLKSLLKEQGLSTVGKKAELIERLLKTQKAAASFGPRGLEDTGRRASLLDDDGLYEDGGAWANAGEVTYMPKEVMMLRFLFHLP